MGGQDNIAPEQVRRSFVALASEMRCPHHFKRAAVEMDGESLDDFSVEVITCCDEFRKSVEEALDRSVGQQNVRAPLAVTVPTHDLRIKYSGVNLPAVAATVSIVPLF